MQFIKKYEHSLVKLCRNYLLPLMLCYAVMRIIINTYFDQYKTSFKLVSLLYMAALFFIYEKVKPKKIVRGIVFFAVGAAVIAVCRVLLSMGWDRSGVWFMNWFYVSSREAGRVNEYAATVFIFFSFFLASIVYYFSIIRFRASGLMLSVLLPFIIYGKRAQSIADFDMVLMVTVYLALVIHGKLTADDVKHDTVFNYSYIIAGLVFVTFVGMVTMFVPKPEITSYLENNRNFFDLRINSDLSAFSSLNQESSDRFGSNATGELLFKVTTNSNDSVLYLRRQTFDDFRNDKWVVNDDIYQRMSTYQSNRKPTGSAWYYYAMMKKCVETFVPTDSSLSAAFDFYAANDPYNAENLRWINLEYEDSFRPSYLCAELNIYTPDSRNSSQIFRNCHSEAYASPYDPDAKSFTYYYYPVSEQMTNFAKSLPFDTQGFLEFFKQMKEQKSMPTVDYTTVEELIEDYTSSEHYVISERMKQLAQELTKDCKNDYEKAEAIVHYFETNGYTYDMDYIPPDESIDYFMFTSKTGSCTSYATAMTLMARSVGLPTRYVEGFAAYEKDSDSSNTFIVRDTNAHAFVECYIAGVGWMTFDPTVPEYMVIRQRNGSAAGIISNIASYLGRAALFLGAGFVLIFIILLDRIDERLFRIRSHSKPLGRRTILLYQRVIKLLNRSHKLKRFDGHTPEQIGEYVKTQLGGNVDKLVALFQSTCFGQQEPPPEQFVQAYEQYRQSWKVISKGKRPEKTKRIKKSPQIQGNL